MIDWSIVVCCYNSEARIKDTLYHIFDSVKNRANGTVEIIIVDNACSDKTVKISIDAAKNNNFLFLKIVREDRPGLMHARIAGTMAASGRYIAFIDDDNWPSEKYFNIAESTFDRNVNIGVFGCATKLPPDRYIPDPLKKYAIGFAIGHLPFKSGLLNPGQSVWGAGMAVRANRLKAIFDSKFSPILVGRAQTKQLAGDDTEIVQAMVLSGSLVWYEDFPLIMHAVDPARFTHEKFSKMCDGFGACAMFLEKYSLSAKGIPVHNFFVFSFFSVQILLKDILIFFKYFLKNIMLGFGTLDFELRSKIIFTKWQCFLSNPKMRSIQNKNITELTLLKKLLDNKT